MPGNGSFNNNPTNPNNNPNNNPRRTLRMPSRSTVLTAGKYALKGAAGALLVARVATHLASSGIYTISKSGCLPTIASSSVNLVAIGGMLAIATTIGIGNVLQGKPIDFVKNVRGGVEMANMITSPIIKGLDALLNLSSGMVSEFTKMGIAQRISNAMGR